MPPGWRPSKADLDRYGRAIPDEEYQTKDFERSVALRARTEAIARHLTEFLKKTDRFAKTIVFCVDQEHADEIRRALKQSEFRPRRHSFPTTSAGSPPTTATSGAGIWAGSRTSRHKRPRFSPRPSFSPRALTRPTCKNVVLARVIGSMSEFKQIIGRGTQCTRRLWQALVQHH